MYKESGWSEGGAAGETNERRGVNEKKGTRMRGGLLERVINGERKQMGKKKKEIEGTELILGTKETRGEPVCSLSPAEGTLTMDRKKACCLKPSSCLGKP